MYDSSNRALSFADPSKAHFDAPPQPLPKVVSTERDLDRWRQENAAAALQVEDLEAERRRSLASATVEAIRALDDRIVTARVRVERAVAVIADSERKFAVEAERNHAARPERRARHKAALKAHAEAERLMREVYGPSAAAIATCLARLTAIDAIISAANSDLPDDAEPIPPMDAFRGYPGVATRYVDQTQTYYVDPSSGEELRPVRYVPKPVGVSHARSALGREIELEVRTRIVRVKDEGRAAYVPPTLASRVNLPGLLHEDPTLWPARG